MMIMHGEKIVHRLFSSFILDGLWKSTQNLRIAEEINLGLMLHD
jgi:hypothetical protein